MKTWIAAGALAAIFTAAPQARAHGLENFVVGLNGVLTAPADPVNGLIDPPSEYDGLFMAPVTAPLAGFLSGTALGLYRAASGVVDMVLTPLWVLPPASPTARFGLVIGNSEATVEIPFAE